MQACRGWFESNYVLNKLVKTIRHPGMIKYIADYETDQHFYLITEPVQPLGNLKQMKEPEIVFGVYNAMVTKP